MYHGILNCYKPKGLTSRDVVNRAYRQLKPSKVGHAGTLDPLAEGVLIVVVGAASRLVPYLHEYTKTYRAVFLLGRSSDSQDVETEVTLHPELAVPSLDALRHAAAGLTGTVPQRPPMYSAIKVGGRRAYDAARNQEALEIPLRHVQVQRFDILEYQYPRVVAEIECGTGTYVRTLGVDLAKHVGTEAVMSELSRTAIGPFRIGDSLRLVDGAFERPESSLRPLGDAVQTLPSILLTADEVSEVRFGRTIRKHGGPGEDLRGAEIAAFSPDGQLCAILRWRQDGWGPKRVFPDLSESAS